ncbi:MAG: hypothetical protein CMB80_31915 [Flammeovirgaceae bacterium]|nr:hypothetical protein [Flammeovirgaceae bacterium]MBR09003.1 hypothetical protein [Rickettsiales bacterium]HCX23356.1 hypothetical protein [Cytophagales bacterium]
MYTLFLHLHSVIRWIVLILALVLIVKSIMKGNYGKLDNILSASYVGMMDLMFLLGLVLYFFLSPITKSAFSDFGGAMSNSAIRFWAVEHIFIMIVAIAVAHIGRSKSKKATDDNKKFKLQLIFYGISLVAMLAGIPWDRL